MTAEAAAYITFDAPIAAGPLANFVAGTFTVYLGAGTYETSAVTPAGPATVVRVACSPSGPGTGSDDIDYDDALQTLIGENGQPVAAFTDFPCAVV